MQKEMNELRNKTLQSFSGQIVGQLLSGVSVFVIGRTLGAAIYGDYIYIHTFLSFFCIIAKLGMENALIYNVSRTDIEKEQKQGIMAFVLRQSVLTGAFLILIGYVFSGWILKNLLNGQNYRMLFIVLLPSILIESFSDLLISILRANKQILEMTISKYIIANLVKIITILTLFYLRFNAELILVVSQYFGSFASIMYCLKIIGKNSVRAKDFAKSRLTRKKQIEIFQYSVPLIFTQAVILVNQNIDKFMLGYMLDSKAVGIYTVAIFISNFSSFALEAVNGIFAPMIAQLYGSGKIDELDYLYKRATRWVMIVNLAIFSMSINFSNEIMQLAGKDFYAGGKVLQILILGQVVNSGVGSVGYLNSMTGHTRINLLTSIIAMAVNLYLNAMFISDYGMIGAAAASAVSLALSNLLNLWFAYKNLGVFPYTKRYIGVVAAFIVSTFLTRIFTRNISVYYFYKLILGGIIFVLIYVICIFFWALEKDEKQMISRLRNKV